MMGDQDQQNGEGQSDQPNQTDGQSQSNAQTPPCLRMPSRHHGPLLSPTCRAKMLTSLDSWAGPVGRFHRFIREPARTQLRQKRSWNGPDSIWAIGPVGPVPEP
jgi:hypothetical protein